MRYTEPKAPLEMGLITSKSFMEGGAGRVAALTEGMRGERGT